MTVFTQQDAQNLVATAEAAPLRNMQHAAVVGDLLRRFAAWYEEVTAERCTSAPPEGPTNAT